MADLTVPTEGSINAFLVNAGTKLILIDSGAGTLYGACCAHLMDSVRTAGHRPKQVDEVFLTHLHADHVSGIAHGGKMAFADAVIRASKLDADYCLMRTKRRLRLFWVALGTFSGRNESILPFLAYRTTCWSSW